MVAAFSCVVGVFLLATCLVANYSKAEEVCLDGWQKLSSAGGELCYKYFDQWLLNWDDAEAVCESVGATLPVLKHTEEKDFVEKLTGETGQVWLGITDREKEGDWHWVDGSPFDNNNDGIKWGKIEPNNAVGGEACGEIYLHHEMVDNKCFNNKKVVCQRRATQVKVCGNGWSYLNTERGQVCYKVADKRMSWDEGKAYCESEGGTLPVLKSHTESVYQQYLQYLLIGGVDPSRGSRDIWFGLRYDVAEEKWQWLDGSSNDIKWKNGEPRSPGSDSCAKQLVHGGMVDSKCSSVNAIICQKNSEK